MSAPEKTIRHGAPARETKTLLIADFDGTIADMIGPLKTLTQNAYEDICALRRRNRLPDHMSWSDFMGEIKNERMPAEYRFHDFERLMYRLRRQSLFLRPRSDTPNFRKACDQIVADYQARQQELLRPFDGVVEALKEVKAEGGKVAIWSDAPAVSIFERMWIMNFPLDLIDAVYVPLRGNEHSDEPLMTAFGGEETAYKKRLMKLFHYLPEKQFKPTAAHVGRILADFGANAKDAVLIGDSMEKDGKSAFLAGIDFVFYSSGAEIVQDHADFYRQFKVSHDCQELPALAGGAPARAKKSRRTNVYRDAKSWRDLAAFFRFGPPRPADDLAAIAPVKPSGPALPGSVASDENCGLAPGRAGKKGASMS